MTDTLEQMADRTFEQYDAILTYTFADGTKKWDFPVCAPLRKTILFYWFQNRV